MSAFIGCAVMVVSHLIVLCLGFVVGLAITHEIKLKKEETHNER